MGIHMYILYRFRYRKLRLIIEPQLMMERKREKKNWIFNDRAALHVSELRLVELLKMFLISDC